MPLLPRKGVLAIAAVIDIALNARGRPVAAKSLASRHRLPPRHLEPVLQAWRDDAVPLQEYEAGSDGPPTPLKLG